MLKIQQIVGCCYKRKKHNCCYEFEEHTDQKDLLKNNVHIVKLEFISVSSILIEI